MKLSVNHDRLGNITAIVASPESPEGTCTVVQRGRQVTEIEFPELSADLDPHVIVERLSNLMRTHRVEGKQGYGRLTPKSSRPPIRPRSKG
jgi:hypothetical protein